MTQEFIKANFIKSSMKKLLLIIDYAVNISPIILLAFTLYFIFLVITPFFLLGIHTVPHHLLFNEQVRYDQAFGSFAGVVGVFLGQPDILSCLLTPIWLLSIINFIRKRKMWVAAVLLIGPIPIAYYAAGPYATAMNEWMIYL